MTPVSEFSPELGQIDVNQFLTAAVASGDEFAIFDRVHPQDVLDHLDDLLKESIYTPTNGILTEAADGDMEQSGISDWTASSATVAKNTTLPMSGDRDLSVTATSGNGYAYQALNAAPGKSYHVSALVKTDGSTTATLQIWDATNSAEIKSYTTSSTVPVRAWFDFSTPSTCYSIQIRLITVTNGQVSYWDDVCTFSYDTRSFTVPWWVKDPAQVRGVFRMSPDSISANEWEPTYRGERDPRWDYLDNSFGSGISKFVARSGHPVYPLYAVGTRNHTAYSNNNSETKRLGAPLVNAGLCYRVFESLASYSQQGAFNMDWIMNRMEHWRDEWDKESRRYALRLERNQTSGTPYGDYYRERDDQTMHVRLTS